MRTSPTPTTNAARGNAAGFFRWENPGEPIAVLFHLNAVELLDRDACDSVRAGKAVAAGILLGKRNEGSHPTFVIESYEPVPIATWKTTDSPFGDRRQMKAIIERWHSKPTRRMDVLGFYRSCAAGETTLVEDDLSVAGENFTQPESLFLLIEPRSRQVSNGRLFLAKDGAVTWEWGPSPFNRAEVSGRGTTPRSAVRQSPVKEEPPRRIEEPRRISEEPQEVVLPVEDGPLNRPKWQWTVAALSIVALMAIGLFYYRGGVTSKRETPKVAVSIDSSLGLKFERTGADIRLTWNPEADAILRATGGQLLISDGPVSKTVNLDASDLRSGTIIYSPLTDDLVLRLQVTTPDSSGLVTESVRIVGGLPTPSAPASSSAHPSSEANSRVVQGQSGHPGLSDEEMQESIKRTSAAALSSRSGSVSAGATKYEAGRRSSVTSLSPRSELRAKLPEEKLTVSKALPSSAARTKAQPATAARSTVAANSHGPAVASKAADPVSPTAPVKAPESIPVIPAASSSVASSSSLPRYVRKGGTVQPAQLLSNVNPIYPAPAKEDGVAGAVELRLKIGTNGDVHDVTVVRGPSILAQAAVDAVRNRKYRPARVDGVPTETDASATFDFKLN